MNIQTQAARNTDPETSHMAAEAITKSGKRATDQQKVLDFVKQTQLSVRGPFTGAEIGEELNKRYPGENWDHYKALRRLGDLKGLQVKHGEKVKCDVLGSMCVTWELIGSGSGD